MCLVSMKMKSRIFRNIDSTRVVIMYVHGTLLNSIVIQQLFHQEEFSIATSSNDVFSFNSG